MMRRRLILGLLLLAIPATAAPKPDLSLRRYLAHTDFIPRAAQGGMSNPPIVFQNQGIPLGVSFTVNCSTGMSCSFVSGVMTLTATGGGGGFPRLDQVLDPTADKTFAMGDHLLKFNNGAVLAGVDDAAFPGITGFALGTQAGFSVGAISLTPLVSLAELNNSAPTITAFSGFAGANIAAFDTRTSGIKIGSLAALQLDATITTSIGAGSLVGASSFIWDQGTGNITQSLLGFDSGVEKDGGTVGQNMVAFHAQSASNGATVTGFVAGMNIEDQSTGSGTSAATYGLKIDDQTLHSPFAIKTGLGKVEFGDSASAVSYLTATNCSSAASPATCGSAAAGSVAVPTGITPTLVVNTTAVTANSQILFTPDESLGVRLGVTCNSTIAQVAIEPIVTARTAATSFTIQYNTTITTNPICLSYLIIN